MHLSVVIDPRNAEHNHSFGFNNAAHDFGVNIFGMSVKRGSEGGKNLFYCLMEHGFAGIPLLNFSHYTCKIFVGLCHNYLLFMMEF